MAARLLASVVVVAALAASRATHAQAPASPPSTAVATSTAPACRTAACHADLFAVTPLSADDVAAMTGVVWRPGCPVPLERLRNVAVGYLGEDGAVHAGTLVVHEAIAVDVQDAFRALLDQGFVVARIAPATDKGGDDVALMRANITSAFNCRAITGGRSFSPHSWGIAVDINPLWNPYVRKGRVSPPEGAAFLVDRDRAGRPGLLLPASAAVAVFERRGFTWGGRWRSPKDWQHVEKRGVVDAAAAAAAPADPLSRPR